MARKRKLFRIWRHRRIDKKTGKAKESKMCHLFFRDHLQIERELKKVASDKSTAEHIAKNIIAIVNFKSTNQSLTKELRDFIENQPKSLRDNLLEWGILDTSTYSGFECLMVYEKVKAKNSKKLKYNVTGGHLYDWEQNMKKNCSEGHIKQAVARVATIIDKCGFIVPSDIDSTKLTILLTDMYSDKSARTCNIYLTSFKSFVNWMVKNKRISHNPIEYVTPFKETEKVRKRRALVELEISALFFVAKNGEKHHGLTGYERYLVYQIAIYTGFRWNEIATLQRRDFDLTSIHPAISVRAENAKNGKAESVPLKPELVAELKTYFKNNPATLTAKAFSGIWQGESAAMIKQDLKLAKIKYKTEKGYADFHALRHTCGTLLAKAGVLPQVAQRIMRHSSIDLTMNHYTHLLIEDTSKAIAKLPAIQYEKAKTGTDDVPENLTANLTENLVKIPQNTVKSSKVTRSRNEGKENVTPSKTMSNKKAGERIRTADVQLGKLTFYH